MNLLSAKVLAAAGAAVAVLAIGGTAYALQGTPPHRIAAQHAAAAFVPADSGSSAAAIASPYPAASTGGAQPQGRVPQQPSTAPVAQAPAAPAAPSASVQPPAPDPLTACATLGDMTTDAGGNLVQCAGSAAPVWVCDPSYPDPSTYPPVPGQPAPVNGWQTVLDVDWTAYVADFGGTWVVTAPPC